MPSTSADRAANPVLLLTQWPPETVGGIETMLRELVREVAQTRDVVVMSMYPSALARLHVKHPRVSLVPRRMLSLLAIPRAAVVARGAFGLVIAGHIDCLPAAIVAARVSKCGLALQTYGWEVARRRRTPLVRWLAGHTDRVLAISRLTRDYVRENLMIPADRVSVIAPGFTSPPARLAPPRRPNGKTLLTVSRLDPSARMKGHDTVIRSLPALVEEFPDLRYVVVGDGVLQVELARLADDLGVAERVEFKGYVDAEGLAEAYASADVFVMPVRRMGDSFEGFGIVYLEAMAAGLACVIGRFSGAADVARDAGVLVDGDSVQSTTRGIRRLLADDVERERCRVAGLALVRQLEWPDVARRFQEAWALT